jgi:hypothetical protein
MPVEVNFEQTIVRAGTTVRFSRTSPFDFAIT